MPRAALSPMDWAVLATYLALTAGVGWWCARRAQGHAGTAGYFLGDRRMPVWAVAFSIIATTLSAATFLGAPEQAYRSDLRYLSANLGSVLAVLFVGYFFVPVFYREQVTSIYELLEHRLGRGAKVAASLAFMGGRVLASGARLSIAAVPVALMLWGDNPGGVPDWQLFAAIGAVSAIAILYTLAGGISSVIWTEVLQTLVLVGSVLAGVVLLLLRIHGSGPEYMHALGSKLTLVGTGPFKWSDAYSLPSAVIAFGLFGVAAYGTDHDLAQRMLTCKTPVRGAASAIAAILINIPITLLFMVLGLLLFVYYNHPEVGGRAAPEHVPAESRQVLLTFILREMPAGLPGLMLAGLLSVGVSSLSSALNAMSATYVKDIHVHLAPGTDDRRLVTVAKLAVVGWGLVLGVFACACVVWQRRAQTSIIDFALGVMTFAYAGLLGVFLTAVFTRRGNSASAIAALVVGALTIVACQPLIWQPVSAWLNSSHPDLAPGPPAWTWQLVLGACLSTATCCLGKRKPA